MSEQPKCHKWLPNVWLCYDRKAHRLAVSNAKFCPECGTRLNADGAVTPMVPAVTSEAVRGTSFFDYLVRATSDPALCEGCYVRCESDEWAIIYAALSQTAGLGAAEQATHDSEWERWGDETNAAPTGDRKSVV